jgi:hypothetical protein
VYRLRRERRVGEKIEVEVGLGITSLSREEAGAGARLALTRGHWRIENGLHEVRDGTLRKGAAAQVMAIVRNLVFLLRRKCYASAAAATRHYVCHPEETLEPRSTSI